MKFVAMQLLPKLVWAPVSPAQQVVEIESGCDHVAARTAGGQVLTWGSGKQGQLGRIGTRLSDRGHTELDIFTTPAPMHLPLSLRSKPQSISCGWYSTFVVLANGHVYATGLNNYGQLGMKSDNCAFAPKRCSELKAYSVKRIAAGNHHTLALTEEGTVLAFGRPTYGRLGLKDADLSSDAPHRTAGKLAIDELEGSVQGIAAGDAISGCFSEQMCGLFLCGSNNTGMLAKGNDDEDEAKMTKVKRTKVFNEVRITQLSFGGQHVAMLCVPTAPAAPAG